MSSTVPATTKSPAKKAVKNKINHPTYDVMIADAIKEIKDKKGIHRSAICNFLANKYFDGEKPKAAILAKALKKAIESNHISLKAPQRYVILQDSTKKPKGDIKEPKTRKKPVSKKAPTKMTKKQTADADVAKSTPSKRGTHKKRAMPAKKAVSADNATSSKSDTEA